MTDRYEVIFETADRYDALKLKSEGFIREIRDNLRLKSEDQNLKSLKQDIEKWIEDRKKDDLIVNNPSNDDILDRILKLFEGKVGRKYEAEELNKIYSDGSERYDKLIPPGYKDNKKNSKVENSGYGDLIIWKQILEYSQNEKIPIVFVTHDLKEDWWNIVKGKTIGPRIELRREFHSATKQKFLMYTMNSFLEYMNTMGNQSISKKVLNEIEEYDEIIDYESINYDLERLKIKNKINQVTYEISECEKDYNNAMEEFNKEKNLDTLERIQIIDNKIKKYRKQLHELFKLEQLLKDTYSDEQVKLEINNNELRIRNIGRDGMKRSDMYRDGTINRDSMKRSDMYRDGMINRDGTINRDSMKRSDIYRDVTILRNIDKDE